MPYKITYLDEAIHDIQETKAWYKMQRNGLQKQFASEVIKAISRLQTHPAAFAIRYKNVRIVHTKIFPYNIHFYIDNVNNTVTVTAIVHEDRDFSGERGLA